MIGFGDFAVSTMRELIIQQVVRPVSHHVRIDYYRMLYADIREKDIPRLFYADFLDKHRHEGETGWPQIEQGTSARAQIATARMPEGEPWCGLEIGNVGAQARQA